MKKWMAGLAAALLCCCAATATAELKFDISVFENNPNYKVELDEMDDTGTIELNAESTILGSVEDDNGAVVGSVDIVFIEDMPPLMRMDLYYVGTEWVFTDNVILKLADRRYTFKANRNTSVSGGMIYEACALVLTDESIQLIKDMIDSNNFTVKMRLDGSKRKVDGSLDFDKEEVTRIYNDYVASRALENDFSLIKTVFPCTIK